MDGRELSVGEMCYGKLRRYCACEEGMCWVKCAWLAKREGSGMDDRISEYWRTCSQSMCKRMHQKLQ